MVDKLALAKLARVSLTTHRRQSDSVRMGSKGDEEQSEGDGVRDHDDDDVVEAKIQSDERGTL